MRWGGCDARPVALADHAGADDEIGYDQCLFRRALQFLTRAGAHCEAPRQELGISVDAGTSSESSAGV
jgi:hypothetical protein